MLLAIYGCIIVIRCFCCDFISDSNMLHHAGGRAGSVPVSSTGKMAGIITEPSWGSRRGNPSLINSLAPGKFEWNFRHVIFKQILVIDGCDISCEIALIWMWLDFSDDRSTLVQVMAWCCQATSHYLSQCWPRSLSPYGVIRPQWVGLSLMW